MSYEEFFEVWSWDRDEQAFYTEDFGETVKDTIDKNQYDKVTDYGRKVGSYCTEDEAEQAASDYLGSKYTGTIVYIWDKEERRWFN